MGVICLLCWVGGGWLFVSYLGKLCSGIGCVYKYFCKICMLWWCKYFVCFCVFMFFVISLIFSFCFSVMMILVIVELIVLEFIVVVNDLLIFSMLGCNVLS